jgi:hypothetical protein
MVPQYTFMSHYYHHHHHHHSYWHHHFRTRFHKCERTRDICPSELGLCCSAWWSLVPFIVLFWIGSCLFA